MNYGKIMKELRTYDLYTQKDIAIKLGISENTYTQYELQNKIIPLKHLNSFSNIFSVSIDYLLGLNDIKEYSNKKEDIDLLMSANRLKALRKESKLTQVQVAKILNTTQSNLVGYETGKFVIATPYLYQICKKYHISADYLLGKIENPKYLK